MAAPRLTNYPTPGFHHWVFNMPVRQPMQFQWKGVYYASGMDPRNRALALKALKRHTEQAEATFSGSREKLVATHHNLANKANTPADLLKHCIALNCFGMADTAAPVVDELVQSGTMDALSFARVLDSLAAPEVVAMLRKAETDNDPHEAMKRAADWLGATRAREASRLLDLAQATVGGGATISHFNGLMSAFLTCGFSDASRVHRQVYDSLGTHKVNPTARTYALVMQSLCLSGNTAEAEAIFNYLRHRHPQTLTVDMYESMILGWTHERDYGKADETWTELLQRGGRPAPTAQTFEFYLKSIFALADTPINAAHLQVAPTDINKVELKRIPGLLKESKALGIPFAELSPIVQYRLNDVLRMFAMHKSRFYNWGRSINQFGYLDWRRRHNAAQHLPEITPAVLSQNRMRPGTMVSSTEQVAAQLVAPPVWEQTPLIDTLNDTGIDETNTRSRDRFTPGVDSIHERSATWMSQVPETRYDRMYGLSKPNLARLGVRRALLDTSNTNVEGLQERDRRIVSQTLSRARRVRTSVDRLRTHREE